MSIEIKSDHTTGLLRATGIPAKGELYSFSVGRTGEGHVRDWNNCSCRHSWGSVAGQPTPVGPHYVSESFVEEVARVIYWADNSIEIVSVTGKTATPVPPNGDACF